MKHHYDTFSTPAGSFSAAINADGAVVATAFGGLTALRRRFTAGEISRSPARLARVRHEVREFFTGRRRSFDLPLAPDGTAFQRRVWSGLQRIPYGATRSYGELAAKLGHPRAARAVGRANATNPICLLIPCHRVIGRDGSLTGFAFGEKIKAQLLAREGVPASKPQRAKGNAATNARSRA